MHEGHLFASKWKRNRGADSFNQYFLLENFLTFPAYKLFYMTAHTCLGMRPKVMVLRMTPKKVGFFSVTISSFTRSRLLFSTSISSWIFSSSLCTVSVTSRFEFHPVCVLHCFWRLCCAFSVFYTVYGLNCGLHCLCSALPLASVLCALCVLHYGLNCGLHCLCSTLTLASVLCALCVLHCLWSKLWSTLFVFYTASCVCVVRSMCSTLSMV